MAEHTNSGYDFSSLGLIQFAWAKRKPLIIISAAAAIISIVVSFMIEPKFKSTVVLFPTSQGSVSKSLLSSQPTGEDGVLTIGEEEQAEHLLQVIKSEVIRSKVIKRFNLMEHYEIGQETSYPYTKLYNEYKSNINAQRTTYQSIEIEVMDKDPQVAADIANYIAALIDTTMNEMMRERAMTAYKVVEDEYRSLEKQIYDLEDSLNVLRDYGVYDYESQAEVMSDAYAQAIAEGNTKGAKLLENQLKTLGKYGGAYVSIRDFLEYEKKQLSELKAKWVEAKVEAEQSLPHKFVVDNAFKAEKKSYPKKSIIVIASTAAAFILAFILLLIAENLKIANKED